MDHRVLPTVAEVLSEYGNPASAQHRAGQSAGELIEVARIRVGSLLQRPVQDVVFTSGATEAAVLGLVGATLGACHRPNVVVSAVEHKAVLAAAELGAHLPEVRCARFGWTQQVVLI